MRVFDLHCDTIDSLAFADYGPFSEFVQGASGGDLVSNGIQEIRENGFGRDNIPAMMAAVVAVSVPLIILFLIFRKKIMAGVSREGIKG